MSEINNKQKWEQYRDSELAVVSSILKQLDFQLEPKQPHLLGEKYLMQAVTTESGKKLVVFVIYSNFT